jgi:hypothetical protein
MYHQAVESIENSARIDRLGVTRNGLRPFLRILGAVRLVLTTHNAGSH